MKLKSELSQQVSARGEEKLSDTAKVCEALKSSAERGIRVADNSGKSV